MKKALVLALVITLSGCSIAVNGTPPRTHLSNNAPCGETIGAATLDVTAFVAFATWMAKQDRLTNTTEKELRAFLSGLGFTLAGVSAAWGVISIRDNC